MRGTGYWSATLLALGMLVAAPAVGAAEGGEARKIDGVLTDSASASHAARKPSLYVRTGYELGALYKPPNFPKKVGLDNHDYISGLHWKVQPRSAKAVGVLHEIKCRPGCANGSYVTYPVAIRAFAPKHCSVEVHKPYSDVIRTVRAYVFNKVHVRALRGKPDPDLVGGDVFSSACR